MQPVPLRLSGFPELGEVTINVPAYYGDSMYPADGNDPALLQMALLTIFRASTPSAAGRTLHGDETTLDALVPAENRWWVPPEVTLTQGTAADDGRRELDIVCQILADEGILVEDAEGDSRLNRGAAADNREDATLSVIEKHLRGGLSPDNPLSAPIEILLTGVWPWGTGVPSNDGWRLVERQVMQRLAATTLLGS